MTHHIGFISAMTANWPAYIEHLHSELAVLVNQAYKHTLSEAFELI